MLTLKCESKFLFMKLKNRIHGHADIHTGKVFFQKVEVQSSQHRHREGEIVP